MFTVRKEIDLIGQMEANVPYKGYAEKRDNSMTLFYSKGCELIRLEYKKKDFMDVLKFYGEDVKKSYLIIYGPKGQPVQDEIKVKVQWIDVEVSYELACRIIARHEYEEAMKGAGLIGSVKQIPFHSKAFEYT